MNNPLRVLKNSSYHSFNRVYISEASLLANYRYLNSIKRSVQIAPVLKSNAYGHGIAEVGKILDELKAPFFCVDSMFEGYQLLKAGIKTPILIMGAINPENLRIKKLPFAYNVFDLDTAQAIAQYQPGARIHIEIDTGLSRLGVQMNDLPQFLDKIQQISHLKIVGFMSHFANAERADISITKKQIKNFLEGYSLVRDAGLHPPYVHMEASAALLNTDVRSRLPMTTIARIGKALYGIEPTERSQKIKPVLSLHTEIVQLKTLKKGNTVGYGATYTAAKDIKMAVLPLGYNEGIDRRLSNKGSVIVGNVVCPIIGRVSMNMATIDVSLVKNPYVGQKVIVISDNRNDPNSIEQIAKKCDTISHELLIHIDSSTRRIVV